MNYLLDTHVCIWAVSEQNKLSDVVKEILVNVKNDFWVSRISLLEIAIKKKTARVEEFNISFQGFIKSLHSSGYNMMELKDEHLETYHLLDFKESHRDPLDRYVLAAARFENFAIITKDEKFRLYGNDLKIVW